MRSPLAHVLPLFMSLFSCAAAYADEQRYDARWYIAPGLAHISPSAAEGTQSGSGWQFALGEPLAADWDLEFGLLNYSLDFEGGRGGSADHTFYGAAALWMFSGRKREFLPFLLLGAGADAQRVADVDSTKPYGSVAFGFLAAPWSWDGSLRLGLQYLHTFGNGDYNDRVLSMGLMIPLGGSGPTSAPDSEASISLPPVRPVPAAGTRAATAPFTIPALLPAPPAATRLPPPSAFSPPAVTADPVPAPSKVIQLEGVAFAFGSDKILPASQPALAAAVRILQGDAPAHAEVAGYSDDRGPAAYNLVLSRRRAEAVMHYLAAHGIDPARLTAKGYGAAAPIATNDTATGRASNRRVELHLIPP